MGWLAPQLLQGPNLRVVLSSPGRSSSYTAAVSLWPGLEAEGRAYMSDCPHMESVLMGVVMRLRGVEDGGNGSSRVKEFDFLC